MHDECCVLKVTVRITLMTYPLRMCSPVGAQRRRDVRDHSAAQAVRAAGAQRCQRAGRRRCAGRLGRHRAAQRALDHGPYACLRGIVIALLSITKYIVTDDSSVPIVSALRARPYLSRCRLRQKLMQSQAASSSLQIMTRLPATEQFPSSW